ncbi:hypothetical protein M885DRAFT_566938 [Pelagophyceae sp. CCMP2097]|nr:hypothetical protein M885DRAFT_566938 [Pelagophyceae sp. CCMP2097]
MLLHAVARVARGLGRAQPCKVSGFDRVGNVIIADLEKGLDAAFDELVVEATKFGDTGHVKNALTAHVAAADKANTLNHYGRVLREPCKEKVMELFQEFAPAAKEWLDKFPPQCLWTVFSVLKQGIITSQGTESQNSADLKSGLRAHVKWEDDMTQVVCFVPSARDASVIRKVAFRGPGKPPLCCKYSVGRYPCLHGAAGIISKHGIQQLPNAVYKFIDESCLTATRQAQMADLADIDAAMLEARDRVAWDAGLRGSKRRKMHCGLCGAAGHNRTECSSRQVDDEASSSDDEDAVA